jgi:hypothetical protein
MLSRPVVQAKLTKIPVKDEKECHICFNSIKDGYYIDRQTIIEYDLRNADNTRVLPEFRKKLLVKCSNPKCSIRFCLLCILSLQIGTA